MTAQSHSDVGYRTYWVAWLILLVTTFALFVSITPARNLPAAQSIAMVIIYVYVARVGATMDLGNVEMGETVTVASS